MSEPATDLLIGIKTMGEVAEVHGQCIEDLVKLCRERVEDLPPSFSITFHEIVRTAMAKQAQLVADARLSKGLAE